MSSVYPEMCTSHSSLCLTAFSTPLHTPKAFVWLYFCQQLHLVWPHLGQVYLPFPEPSTRIWGATGDIVGMVA